LIDECACQNIIAQRDKHASRGEMKLIFDFPSMQERRNAHSKKKGLILSYQTYAFDPGCMTRF
jgi:hypothetical protein